MKVFDILAKEEWIGVLAHVLGKEFAEQAEKGQTKSFD